jgi:hypothetical protein
MSIRNNSVIDRWEREVSKPLGPSEYGGYSGEVQPPPHEMTADERARMQRRIPAAGKDSDLTDEEMAARYMATGGAPAEGTEG